MEHVQTIHCIHCVGKDLVKWGTNSTGIQRWRCKGCKKSFQLQYIQKASEPGAKDKIIELTLNGSGVRDISRVMGVHRDTVTATLRKKSLKR